MKIYTKTGDGGLSALPGGSRARKSEAIFHAVGALDELNCHVGLCLAAAGDPSQQKVRESLEPLQPELLTAGVTAAAAAASEAPNVQLQESSVERMEGQIDAIWDELGGLEHFIIPGGCELACRLHLARTVCRRAERWAVTAVDDEVNLPIVLVQYLNRLSDLLFALARQAEHAAGGQNRLWNPQDT